MRFNPIILFGLLAFICCSCYTYKIYPKEFRKLENNRAKRTVYILNDADTRTGRILKASELFEIVTDSTMADLKIKLHPIQQSYVCGQPLTLSMITFGQFPVYLPDRYFFRFDEIEDGVVTEHRLELKIAKRYWFWDMLAFNKNFEKKAGKALLGEYLANSK